MTLPQATPTLGGGGEVWRCGGEGAKEIWRMIQQPPVMRARVRQAQRLLTASPVEERLRRSATHTHTHENKEGKKCETDGQLGGL